MEGLNLYKNVCILNFSKDLKLIMNLPRPIYGVVSSFWLFQNSKSFSKKTTQTIIKKGKIYE